MRQRATATPGSPPAKCLRAKKYGPQPVRTEARECGSGYAMERAVREGDTGLHHTAKTRRCVCWIRNLAAPAATMVSRGDSIRNKSENVSLPAAAPGPPPSPPVVCGQASRTRLRTWGIMPATPRCFNRVLPGFSTPRNRRWPTAAVELGEAACNCRWRRRLRGGSPAPGRPVRRPGGARRRPVFSTHVWRSGAQPGAAAMPGGPQPNRPRTQSSTR